MFFLVLFVSQLNDEKHHQNVMPMPPVGVGRGSTSVILWVSYCRTVLVRCAPLPVDAVMAPEPG